MFNIETYDSEKELEQILLSLKINKEKALELITDNMDYDTLSFIRLCLEENVDLSIPLPKYNKYQIYEIKRGIKLGLDASIYAKPEYNEFQMSKIIDGLKKGLDVSKYADPNFDSNKMSVIMRGLENNINMLNYIEFDYDKMEVILEGLLNNIDVSVYAKHEFNTDQMYEIKRGLENGIDTTIYADPKFDDMQMEGIRDGLEHGIDASIYAKYEYDSILMNAIESVLIKKPDIDIDFDKFNYMQLYTISRYINQVDISKYLNPEHDYEEMEQLFQGLKYGLDVTKYDTYGPVSMKKIKNKLLIEKIKDMMKI